MSICGHFFEHFGRERRRSSTVLFMALLVAAFTLLLSSSSCMALRGLVAGSRVKMHTCLVTSRSLSVAMSGLQAQIKTHSLCSLSFFYLLLFVPVFVFLCFCCCTHCFMSIAPTCLSVFFLPTCPTGPTSEPERTLIHG